ncbi:MAG: homoserine O-acetyltransferase [Coleofasciculus sp. S288]|nr:homoserine O-acetyltransferase [Coleofasciculus sp. S288]
MKYNDFISSQTQFYHLPNPLLLESGEMLLNVRVAYRTWGKLNKTGDNAVLICHALTGWADADDWWAGLFGEGKAFDPQTDFIVCSNVLGSCYGTTSPTSINPVTGKVYGPEFPPISIRDMVRVQAALVEGLRIQRIKLVIGGSLGGMQVLEWALLYPELVEAIAPFATSGRHSAWCIGLGEAQRQAIYADPHWQGGYYTDEQPPVAGLAAARMIAMSTYRSPASFEVRFGRQLQTEKEFAIASYLRHQGEKLVNRFDANTYVTLTQAMDRHDIAYQRGEYETVLSAIAQPTLVVAIDSDVLYPPPEQQELAAFIPNAHLAWLHSLHGHDAFLLDMDVLNNWVVDFRTNRLNLTINYEHRIGDGAIGLATSCGCRQR